MTVNSNSSRYFPSPLIKVYLIVISKYPTYQGDFSVVEFISKVIDNLFMKVITIDELGHVSL